MRLELGCSWRKMTKHRLRLMSLSETLEIEGDNESTIKSKLAGVEDDTSNEEDRTRLSRGSEEAIFESRRKRRRRRRLDNDQENCDEEYDNNSNSSQLKSIIRKSSQNRNKVNAKSSKTTFFGTLNLSTALIGLIIIISQLGEYSLQVNGSFPPPQPNLGNSANSIGNLLQSMAQMLQVFNGNDSQHLEANHFKLLERDGDFVLVGAR